MFYLEVSSFHCLHVSTSFFGLQSYGFGSSSTTSRGVYAPQAPRAGRFPQFHYLDYPYYAGPELMSSRAQLLLRSSLFDNLHSLSFPLPHLQWVEKLENISVGNIIRYQLSYKAIGKCKLINH